MRYTLFLLCIYFVFAKSTSLSKIMVTGPSLCISTSISAPNSPVCTFTPLAAVMALNSSYRREASPGSAAPLKLGRLPWRQEAYSVNCDMESTLPPTSSKLKFILPASSSKNTQVQHFICHGRQNAAVIIWAKAHKCNKAAANAAFNFSVNGNTAFFNTL